MRLVPKGPSKQSSNPEKPKRKQKCIITFARSWNALAATRCLGRNGIEVIAGDTSRLAAASLSRYAKKRFTYPCPDEDPERFIDKLVQVAEKHGGPDTDLVLMPLHMCAYTVACNRDRFDGLAKMAIPSKEQFELAGDKGHLARFCQENNFRTPPTLVADTPEEFYRQAPQFKYPAFLKVRTAAASIGLRKVYSSEEAIEYFDECVEEYGLRSGQYPILQEGVDGEDYCSTFLFDNGEPRAAMTYHNILDYPRKSGMGAVRETVDVPRMEAMGIGLLRTLKWHGVAEVDFRWDGKSDPWLIEINPRFWGGLAQSIESGWDYPYLLYRLAVDGHLDVAYPHKHDVRTKNPCLTTLLMVQEFLEAGKNPRDLKPAFQEFKKEIKAHHLGAVGRLFRNIEQSLNPTDRLKAVGKVLAEERGATNELFKWKDPLPMMGLLYPLTVFVKKGRVNPELLVSHTKPKSK